MIRFLTRSLISLVALAGLAGTAQAAYVPATWTDTYNVPRERIAAGGKPFSYSHNLVSEGFDIGNDWVTDFVLTVDLFDDGDSQKESAKISFLGFSGTEPIKTFVYDSADHLFSFFGLIELNLLGQLTVNITAKSGDFFFGGSELVANGYSNSTSVPEPSSLALLGIGLLGIAAGARRRKANVAK